ncbi:DYL2 protein, partial [Lophotis ruficrista]|nr:DYL2 protein [Lophotis ruficrista]
KNADLSEEMQQDAVRYAILAVEKHSVEREITILIKRESEKKHRPTWQCTVGGKFDSSVSHETKHFTYFLLLGVNILLFEAG